MRTRTCALHRRKTTSLTNGGVHELDGQDFLFLLLGHIFEFSDVFIGDLLNLFQGPLFVILRDRLVLQHFFQMIINVATDVADGSAVIFEYFMDVLGKLLTSVLGQRWNWNA